MPVGFRVCLAFACLSASCGGSFAQSGIGFEGAELALSADARGRPAAHMAGAFRITGNHGLQAGVSASDLPGGWHGSLDGHFYLIPGDGLTYGLYGQLADRNDHDVWSLTAGAEMRVPVGAATAVEARAGLGLASDPVEEFIDAGIAVSHRLGSGLRLDASLDIALFDEAGFSANLASVSLGAIYQPETSPLGAFLRVERHIWTGRDAAPDETRAIAGIMLRLGSARTEGETGLFRTRDVIAPLIAAGVF
jgi:hypothetical protein